MEKITKSWIEKAIHEKAVRKYEDKVNQFFKTLSQTFFAGVRLKFHDKSGHYFDFDILEDKNFVSEEIRDDFLHFLFKDYDALEERVIKQYERDITNNLLDDMSGLREFLED